MKKENRKMAQILLGKEVTASLNEEIEEKVKKIKRASSDAETWNYPNW